jgi:hypothetical protein
VFDPSTDGHLEKMQEMAPIDRETVSIISWLIRIKPCINSFLYPCTSFYRLMIHHNFCVSKHLSNSQPMYQYFRDLHRVFCSSLIC